MAFIGEFSKCLNMFHRVSQFPCEGCSPLFSCCWNFGKFAKQIFSKNGHQVVFFDKEHVQVPKKEKKKGLFFMRIVHGLGLKRTLTSLVWFAFTLALSSESESKLDLSDWNKNLVQNRSQWPLKKLNFQDIFSAEWQ